MPKERIYLTQKHNLVEVVVIITMSVDFKDMKNKNREVGLTYPKQAEITYHLAQNLG